MKQSNISLFKLEPQEGFVLYNAKENIYSFCVYSGFESAFSDWEEIEYTEEIQSKMDSSQDSFE